MGVRHISAVISTIPIWLDLRSKSADHGQDGFDMANANREIVHTSVCAEKA